MSNELTSVDMFQSLWHAVASRSTGEVRQSQGLRNAVDNEIARSRFREESSTYKAALLRIGPSC